MSERYDTIVIGAGMSGLAAAIRLAHHERRVVVLERHYLWGGLNSFYKLGGRRFDVGLHALTNYVPQGTRGAPLTRLLRQLRLRHSDLKLGEQSHSEILFPGVTLTFSNDFGRFEEEVASAFPAERDRFRELVDALRAYDINRTDPPRLSGRAELERRLSDPLLREMLLLPVCYYCSAQEGDVDWHQFVILFRSMFLEGLARPEGGIRTLLNLLVQRYRSLDGELRMQAGVKRILVDGGTARGVELDDGTVLEADHVLSSAGYVETMRLAGAEAVVTPADVGRLSFVESISVLDRTPAEIGHTATTSFFSTRERFDYRVPDDLVDVRSGVISAPNNFASREPMPEGLMRLTCLADHDRWCGLSQDEYEREKERSADAAVASVSTFTPDWRPHTVFRDVFTPRTIRHFTGHLNGAVYGSPTKRLDGATGIHGLTLCGTDQGYLGVIGALISGIAMANRHALAPTGANHG